ncbi:MAG TPA: AI-2E family transporter [Candidatus Limnocylindrales bacterium]|nr:AI-2E family transporter [Candidatus Limnocylindrales bacterium]
MIADGGGFGRSVVRGAGFAVGVALIAAMILVGIAAINVLVLVFVALILASGLQPVIAWIRGHVPIGRGPTILLVYGAFFAIVIALALVIVPAAIGQFERTIASLPPFFENARAWARTLRPGGLATTVTSLIDAAAQTLRPGAAPEPGQVVQVGLTVAEAVVSLATLLTVVFFWLTEHARLQRYALAFVPQERRKRAHEIWNTAETRLGMWVRGQLILMGAIGLATGIAYTLLGVPAALLLGLIAALAEGIPIVGPLLGAIPAVLVATTVSPQLALEVAVVYVILQIVEGNVLVPLVMRNTTGISPFLVILSVLIGGTAGGFVGALLAVPIAAAGEVLIEGLQAREIPVAQDPSAVETTDDEENPPDAPDRTRRPRLHGSDPDLPGPAAAPTPPG